MKFFRLLFCSFYWYWLWIFLLLSEREQIIIHCVAKRECELYTLYILLQCVSGRVTNIYKPLLSLFVRKKTSYQPIFELSILFLCERSNLITHDKNIKKHESKNVPSCKLIFLFIMHVTFRDRVKKERNEQTARTMQKIVHNLSSFCISLGVLLIQSPEYECDYLRSLSIFLKN